MIAEWLPSVFRSRPDYSDIYVRYGRAGLFKTDQSLEAVTSHRIQGFVAVISETRSPSCSIVVHSLNVLGCAAVAPGDFDTYFPKFFAPESRKAVFYDIMLEEASQLVVVPFEGWQSDPAIWRAVKAALRVNKRVTVIRPAVVISW